MTDWNLPWEGGCRCARLRFRVSKPPLMTMACHCTGCQKMTSSAFSLSVAVPPDGFEIIAGEAAINGLHGHPHHHGCPWCMSWVFTTFDHARHVYFRPTLLDEPRWFSPFIESYVSEKLPWATTPAAHSFEKFPPREGYAELLAEFAALPVPLP